MKRAVVLISGGMDSAVCLGIAMAEGYDIVGVHANYSQRTEKKELECFKNLCKYYNVKERFVVNFEHFRLIGSSCLTDKKIDVPDFTGMRKEVPISYVPFRNANLLSVATSIAEAKKAEAVFIGAVEEDSSGYPDCRKVFIEAFNRVIQTGTKPDTDIKIFAPLIDMNKAEIVKKGLSLKVPFELTWSCYKNSDIACGKCDSCVLRLRAFKNAGVNDFIDYEI